MVISTALFDKPAFKNLVVNGLVLAEDGKKMSKRALASPPLPPPFPVLEARVLIVCRAFVAGALGLKNYPDPMKIVDAYGADALRLYLINSPVVKAEPLRFKEQGVKDIVKDLFVPWFNSYRFFVEQHRRYQVVRVAACSGASHAADERAATTGAS
jgi:isoleucyl-tRNA synthetase